MSFDLSFLWCGGNLNPSSEEIDFAFDFKGAASLEDQSRMRQLAEDLVSAYDEAEWGESGGGLAQGAWVSGGDLPDIDIRPREVFVSSRADPGNPEHLAFFVGLLEFFEAKGYACFDMQRGEIVYAKGFSFG